MAYRFILVWLYHRFDFCQGFFKFILNRFLEDIEFWLSLMVFRLVVVIILWWVLLLLTVFQPMLLKIQDLFIKFLALIYFFSWILKGFNHWYLLFNVPFIVLAPSMLNETAFIINLLWFRDLVFLFRQFKERRFLVLIIKEILR